MVKKKPKRKKIQTTTKVLIICEGITDESLIRGMLNDYGLMTDNIELMILKGQGYVKFAEAFAKEKKLYQIILYVTDLDRAVSNYQEKRRLKGNFKLITDHNSQNNIFLSYPEIEVYIAASIGLDEARYGSKEAILKALEQLGYEKGNTAYRFYSSKQGSNDKAKDILGEEYYLFKKDDKLPPFLEENLTKNQSTLTHFIEYLSEILKR